MWEGSLGQSKVLSVRVVLGIAYPRKGGEGILYSGGRGWSQ